MAQKPPKKKNSKVFNEQFRHRIIPYRSIIVIGFALITVVVLLIGYKNMLIKEQAYQESIDALNTDIEQLQENNTNLKNELKNMDTDEFKEKIARERLGMVGKDELLFKESKDGTTGRGAPETVTTETIEDTIMSEEEN